MKKSYSRYYINKIYYDSNISLDYSTISIDSLQTIGTQ